MWYDAYYVDSKIFNRADRDRISGLHITRSITDARSVAHTRSIANTPRNRNALVNCYANANAFAHANASGDATHLIPFRTCRRYCGFIHVVSPCPATVKKTGLFSDALTHALRLLYFQFGPMFLTGSAG